MTSLRKLAVGAALVAASFGVRATTVSAFSNASSLDFQGQFLYALSMNPGAAGVAIGDATFRYLLGGVSGAAVSYQYYIQSWHPFNYGAGTDNTNLGTVMRSIVWNNGSNSGTVVNLTLSNLTVGQTYKAQLLFAEACCDRGFDVYRNGLKIADNVSPYVLSGNNYYGSAVVTETFVASSTSVTFGLGYNGGRSDINPILNAATLETVSVPEPAPLGLLAGALGLTMVARRRATRTN